MKPVIQHIVAREIFDSRGYPTVEAEVILSNAVSGRMSVPSGASTGRHEAIELRDGGKRHGGKGVLKAVEHIREKIQPLLLGREPGEQETIDRVMIELDGTPGKSVVGANAMLAVSMAVAHAAANLYGIPLYQHLLNTCIPAGAKPSLPVPMVNIISGGAHAGRRIDMQDFLVIPLATSFGEAMEIVFDVYRQTKELLLKKGYEAHLLADEGGFGPRLRYNEEALEILSEVFVRCGLQGGKDIAIAIDVASSGLYDTATGCYGLNAEKRLLDTSQMINMLEQWCNAYPVISIEDGLAEDDWEGWAELTRRLGNRIQLVGDDLFTTNPDRIRRGIDDHAGNAVLIKMNQVGTLTETIAAIRLAKANGFRTIISARSGETEDHSLAHLAVGLQGGQIKIGSVAGSSRLAKYNELLRIAERVGDYAAITDPVLPALF